MRLCVEPLNSRDFAGYLVPDVNTALRILERVDSPAHCCLQLDLYHVAMGEQTAALEPLLHELLPHAAHVQIANPPGRNEPGVGDVDFVPLLELLDDGELSSYDGFVGCEYKPSTDATGESLGWARKWLRPRSV